MPRALLISTYDLGHQPFGLASPAAWLARDGFDVRCADLSKDRLDEAAVRDADLIALHLPMHTATRMAASVIRKVRALHPGVRLCAYGLYAPLNEAWLRSLGVDDVMGGEFEARLSEVARSLVPGAPGGAQVSGPTTSLARLQFLTPDRRTLPPLTSYATLTLADGTPRVAGYTEASRGCLHLCRHCPVVPVYNGQFRVVQADVVLADIAAQVQAGAAHITFGDPDFFNGPTHALRLVEAVHAQHPSLTYDVTIKVEHLLRHEALLPRLRETGCLMVTSAVESFDDRVLALLLKGHTRDDVARAVAVCRAADVVLVPTFVAFHPWLSLDGYCDLLDTIEHLDLIEHVAPIQLAIRLLVPAGSRLLDVDDVRALIGAYDPATLAYRWVHADPRVDALHAEVSAIVGTRLAVERRGAFEAIRAAAYRAVGRGAPPPLPARSASPVPQFDEAWYCCAEPNPDQLVLL